MQIKYNPIWYHSDFFDQKAVVGILLSHPRLGWLGDQFEDDQSMLCCPKILHLLDVNRCGRVLIDGKRHVTTVTDSAWPLLLARANRVMGRSSGPLSSSASYSLSSSSSFPNKRRQQSRSANAIYYLISRGAAFADSGKNGVKNMDSTRSMSEETQVRWDSVIGMRFVKRRRKCE